MRSRSSVSVVSSAAPISARPAASTSTSIRRYRSTTPSTTTLPAAVSVTSSFDRGDPACRADDDVACLDRGGGERVPEAR
jgi:hypothetical protein